jgi:hypothetical protein
VKWWLKWNPPDVELRRSLLEVRVIASYKLLLPYVFHVLKLEELTPYRTTVDRFEVTLYPPFQAAVETVSFGGQKQVARSLLPASPQVPSDDIKIFDQDTLEANLLKIDFKAPDFDRRRGHEQEDPPSALVFSIANRWLGVLRTVLQSPHIRSIEATEWFWRLDYTTDAGEELPSSVDLFKMTTGMRFSQSLNILDKAQWDAAVNFTLDADIPIYIPLILDAKATLPDIGTAITLASIALETLIERHLGRLAAAKCAPPELWSWITKRGFKEPSTEEQFDRLLKILSGKSLKDEPPLWKAFKNLTQARNNFVHRGRAEIGEELVTVQEAMRLLEMTKDIIKWVEGLAPEGDRWLVEPPVFEIALATPPFPVR